MKRILYSCAALIAAFTVPVGAQSFTPIGTPAGDGGQFWDSGNSSDGPGCNIGYILTNAATGSCNNQRPAGWLPYTDSPATSYFNNGSGGWNGFLVAGAGSFTVSFIGNTVPLGGFVAGANPEDWGWFDYTSGTTHDLNGFFIPGTTTTINPTGLWGLYIRTTDGVLRYSTVDPQFSAFLGGFDGIDFGLEDISLRSGNSDKDYNDIVFNIQGTDGRLEVVPEPASMTLLATGLAGMAAAGLRRRRNKK